MHQHYAMIINKSTYLCTIGQSATRGRGLANSRCDRGGVCKRVFVSFWVRVCESLENT